MQQANLQLFLRRTVDDKIRMVTDNFVIALFSRNDLAFYSLFEPIRS